MQEVGGSIPPGSTSLRSLREPRLAGRSLKTSSKKPPLPGGFLLRGGAQHRDADKGRHGNA
jgi:hypothetical protein